MGYSEILTYSFGSPSMFDLIRLPEDSPLRKPIKILNPLGEDTSVMRTTSLPCMLETLARNNAHRNKAAKLYELAKIYLPVAGEDLPKEDIILTLGSYGENEDFFSLKGEIEALLRTLNVKPHTVVAQKENPSYHPVAALTCMWTASTWACSVRCILWWLPTTASPVRSTAPS